jgi:hypothetical protein
MVGTHLAAKYWDKQFWGLPQPESR